LEGHDYRSTHMLIVTIRTGIADTADRFADRTQEAHVDVPSTDLGRRSEMPTRSPLALAWMAAARRNC
jgi:hypothetical protein